MTTRADVLRLEAVQDAATHLRHIGEAIDAGIEPPTIGHFDGCEVCVAREVYTVMAAKIDEAALCTFGIEVLKPEEGSVIILHLPDGLDQANPHSLERLGAALGRAFPRTVVIAVPSTLNVEEFSEAAMRVLGWVRAPS